MILVLIFDASEAFNLAVLRTPFFFSRIRSLTSLRPKETSEAFQHAIAGGEEEHQAGWARRLLRFYSPRAEPPPRRGRYNPPALHRPPTPLSRRPPAKAFPHLTSPQNDSPPVAPEKGRRQERRPHLPQTFEFKPCCRRPASRLAPPRRRAGRARLRGVPGGRCEEVGYWYAAFLLTQLFRKDFFFPSVIYISVQINAFLSTHLYLQEADSACAAVKYFKEAA